MKKEKESECQSKWEQKIQKSLKEDLWFGKGVASALTGLDLILYSLWADIWSRSNASGAAEC